MAMDRRAFLRSTLGAAGALALGACSPSRDPDSGPAATSDVGTPVPRPTLRIPGGSFGFPSPFAYIAGPGYWRMSYIYDTLLWNDSTGQLLPWLASRYERSSDGLVYTFELRNDVRWHDGQPLTPDDVVFTFQYFAAQFLSGLVVAQPRNVAEARATGGQNVQIRLTRPAVTFARDVAGAVPIVPKHIWSSIADPAQAQDPKVLVGSGPYRLESFSDEEGSYLYSANDGFFLGRPFVKRLELRPVGDDELRPLLAGETDGGSPPVSGVGPDALAPFRANRSFGVIEQRSGFTFPLYWNLSKGGTLADVRFRRACAMAIDRGDIVERLLKGNGTPGNPGFLPVGHPFHVEVDQYRFDPAAANRLLDEAGYARSSSGVRQAPDGKALRFGLLVANTGPPALAELVVNGLKAVGIEAVPEFVDLVRLFGSKTGRTYDMAITLYPGPGGPSPTGDPDYLRTIYSSNIFNRGFHSVDGYANPEVDELAERQLVTSDEAERRRLVARMQQIAARDLPVLPLYYSTIYFVFRRPVFDQWYYVPGGGATGTVYNKHAFVTGLKRGLEIRPTR